MEGKRQQMREVLKTHNCHAAGERAGRFPKAALVARRAPHRRHPNPQKRTPRAAATQRFPSTHGTKMRSRDDISGWGLPVAVMEEEEEEAVSRHLRKDYSVS